jgi:medium-chain acyl-[acyl-carrier-protein] hydrolase
VTDERWLVRWPETSSPALRLVCFGHAAAGAAGFRSWARVVPPHIEVSAVRLPGRESRVRETPYDDVQAVVGAALPALEDALEAPFALFGHCSGGLIAFELARELARRGRPSPLLLAVAGQVAPRAHAVPAEHRALDLRERLRRLGADESDAIMSSERLFSALEPAIAADFRMVDAYAYRPAPPLAAPIAVFAAARHESAESLVASGWAAETTAGCDVRVLDADHLFGGGAWSELAAAVAFEAERRADEAWE